MNIWDKKDIPQKGWEWIGVDDFLEPDFNCEMCGQTNVRYVHHLIHKQNNILINVGCICAEKMTDDYTNPRKTEKYLKSVEKKKSRWLTRKWKTSKKGNDYMNINGFNITVFQYKKGHNIYKWGYKIDDNFSSQAFQTEDEAKLALFDELF